MSVFLVSFDVVVSSFGSYSWKYKVYLFLFSTIGPKINSIQLFRIVYVYFHVNNVVIKSMFFVSFSFFTLASKWKANNPKYQMIETKLSVPFSILFPYMILDCERLFSHVANEQSKSKQMVQTKTNVDRIFDIAFRIVIHFQSAVKCFQLVFSQTTQHNTK